MSFAQPIIRQQARCLRQIPLAQCRGFASTPLAFLALRMNQQTTVASTKSRFLPRFLQPDQLNSYLPSFLSRQSNASKKKKEWNPYTFFIAAFLIIGSQAINTIALRHEHRDFMRRAENRIDLLREVVERIERGEDVDIGKILGAGVESEENSWEEVLKEIEQEDLMWQAQKARKQSRAKEQPVNEEDKFVVAEAVERKPRPAEKVDDSTFL